MPSARGRAVAATRIEPAWPFDLAATLNSGQAFQWRLVDGAWVAAAGGEAFSVRQDGGAVLIQGNAQSLARHLALDHDMDAIMRSFPQADATLAAAAAWCPGLRILRQPVWECLAAFITSSMKKVAHIAQISHRLRERFGTRIGLPGGAGHVWDYPGPEALASAGEKKLRACGLGYRAGFLAATARLAADGQLDLEALRALPDEEAELALRQAPGVGPKIARCVLLFACERLGVVPIDVWVERLLRDWYFKGKAVPRRELEAFVRSHFGPQAGYAQQFLFHYARLNKGAQPA